MDDPPQPGSYAWLVIFACLACVAFLAYRRRERWLGDDHVGRGRAGYDSLGGAVEDDGPLGRLYSKAHSLIFRKAGDVRDAVERGMDRGVRLSIDDLPSRHEFIAGSPTSEDSVPLPISGPDYTFPTLSSTHIGSSPTLDKHVNALRSAQAASAADTGASANSGLGLGIDLSSDTDPLGASTEMPLPRRTLSSNSTNSSSTVRPGTAPVAPGAVSSKAAKLLGLSPPTDMEAGRRYTDTDVPAKAGKLLGLASSAQGVVGQRRSVSARMKAAGPGHEVHNTARKEEGETSTDEEMSCDELAGPATEGWKSGDRTRNGNDSDQDEAEGAVEAEQQGTGDARWVITDDD